MQQDTVLQASSGNTARPDVLLVSMPFGPLQYPSIGLSILRARLAADLPDCVTDTHYFTFDWAELIGFDLYSWVEESNPAMLVGEYLFSAALFDKPVQDEAEYITQILLAQKAGGPSGEQIAAIRQARAQVDAFIARCVARIAAIGPRVLGFTSVFQQNIASLALARQLKQCLPDIKIIIGGANCEGAMGLELARQFPFLDAVCSGEGEALITPLITGLLNGSSTDQIAGVFTQKNIRRPSNTLVNSATPLEDMDSVPELDYSGFFRQWQQSGMAQFFHPSVLFETSRGCWWGQKNHCTFCGLNGSSMKYRSKSAPRALAELSNLVRQYPQSSVIVVDNILDMGYFDDFLPDLVAANLGVHLFYEVKSNLKKSQLQILRDAGVTTLQPGIESLSTPVLKIMKKGVSGILNIQMLKWCKQLGITPLWNFLVGFPGEAESEYARMAELAPKLRHLPPPHHCTRIRLDRFSPNFDHAEKFGFRNVRPLAAYAHAYQLDAAALHNIAYFFDFDYADGRDVGQYLCQLQQQTGIWRQRYPAAELVSMLRDEEMLVWDFRDIGGKVITVCQGAEKFVLQHSDAITSLPQLLELARESAHTPAQIEAALQQLLARGFVLQDGAALLSLVIALEEYVPNANTVDRLMQVLQTEAV